MRVILALFICFILTSCGSIFPQTTEEESKPEYSSAVQILEKNKDDLNTIKNNTADDIVLGHKTRVLEKKKPEDEDFGAAVRSIVHTQAKKAQTSKQNAEYKLIQENEFDFVLPCIVLFLINIVCLIGLFLYIRKCFHELCKK